MYRVFLPLLLLVSLASAERSVYGSASKYGSPSKNKQRIIVLNQEISQLKQEIDGLRSVVEGMSQSIGELRQAQASRGDRDESKMLYELIARVDKLSKNTKQASTKKTSKPTATITSSSKESSLKERLSKAKSSDLFSRGVRLVKKKKYTLAKLRFDILKKRGYKKASTLFYLGEIAYRGKRYIDAIDYYKKSSKLNDGANYMDTLLLHSAISLEKRGNKTQARRFFQAIVDGYPDTASATVAKKHL